MLIAPVIRFVVCDNVAPRLQSGGFYLHLLFSVGKEAFYLAC